MPADSLKIVHVVQAIARSFGGVQAALAGLTKAQAAAGYQVSVVSTNVDSPTGTLEVAPNSLIEKDGVRMFACAVMLRGILFSPSFSSIFRREASRADIVHIHGLYRFPPTYAAYYARKKSIPYVIRPHGSLDPYMYGKSTANALWLKRLYERWFDLPNLHAAGAIHFTAEDERQRAAFLKVRAPSFVVPNGIDWSTYQELPSRGALRAQWGLGEAPVVLFLGRLHFKKGFDLLVPAFDALRHRLPEARLVIAGPENDDYGKKVRGWVRERGLDSVVHFAGPLFGADVVQAYVDADVFALPSYTENFGMTVAEAMACGLPVVISDQVNIHAEVARAGAGFVTRCDAEEVADAFEVLLRGSHERRAMGVAGRKLVKEHYTWPAIVDALTREYEAVIERHRQASQAGVGERSLPL